MAVGTVPKGGSLGWGRSDDGGARWLAVRRDFAVRGRRYPARWGFCLAFLTSWLKCLAASARRAAERVSAGDGGLASASAAGGCSTLSDMMKL